MDEFYFRKSHVPAFGSWDCNNNNNDLPFTECFESARQASVLRYSYSEDRDLYVAGDLYDNAVVTPAVIVVPRRRHRHRSSSRGQGKGKGEGKKEEAGWVVCDYDYDYKYEYDSGQVIKAADTTPDHPDLERRKGRERRVGGAVDEDLYKISPHLIPKRKRGWGFFSSCIRSICVN